MNKKTYNILTFTIGGLVVFGGRYIGLSLLQRIIAFIVIGGLFEIIYRKTKKENDMKKLLLLSALLIFACSSDLFAQDYMKMSKKQLRIEHQKKLNLIDSLSQELSFSNKKSQNLQSDLNNSSNDLILTSDSLKNSNLEINQSY